MINGVITVVRQVENMRIFQKLLIDFYHVYKKDQAQVCSSLIIKTMLFNIQETYGAIPCTITYDVLDSSLNSIVTNTISNPPGPPPPGCFSPMPAFIEVTACGTTFRVSLNPGGCCQDFLLNCSCIIPTSWYAFSFCLVPTPGGTCPYVLNINC